MIYPGGSMWFRRVSHLCMISLISLNLWLNGLQDQMLIKSKYLVEQTQEYLPSTVRVCEYIEMTLPLYKKIESSRWTASLLEEERHNSEDIQLRIDGIRQLERNIPKLTKMFGYIEVVLGVLTLVMAVQILYSLIWILLDIRYGNQCTIVLILLALAILLNVKIANYLETIASII